MDGPNAGTWVVRLEHLSGLTAWHGRSLRSVLFSLFLYALALVAATYFVVTPEEPTLRGGRWFYASLALWSTATVLSMVGYSLSVGKLGRPRERWGGALRRVAALGAIPSSVFMVAAVSYMVFGVTGVVVGGVSILLLQAASLLRQRRDRRPIKDEPDDPNPSNGGSP